MSGHVTRVAGPTATVRGLSGVALNELVLVGEERLLGEVVRIEGDLATVQVYEDTSGLRPGEPAASTGGPLAAELGPGLLGLVLDGVQRPLAALAAREGDFLARGATMPALDRRRRFRFEPALRAGDELRGGEVMGLATPVDGAPGSTEKVLVPPGARGRVADVGPGELSVDDPAVRLEGGGSLSLVHRWPVRRPRPVRRRLSPDVPFLTGQRVLDCFFPVACGGTAIVPGGFGTGKTVLEQSLAKHAAADVIVYVGCGERGNEMAEVLDEFPRLSDPRSGRPLLERTVLVVNTSNMPVAAREASIYFGVTLAEYFRDQSLQVALMIDSTSRWAEALREISSRLEEMPGEEGYPTSLASRVAQFYERAGRAVPLSGQGEGAVTIVGAVSPPGGDFSEPVTQSSLRASGALWALSADLAHRRHFPAVDWGLSFSLDAPRLEAWFRREAGDDWVSLRDEAMRLMQRERELLEIAQLVGVEALQDAERVVIESARLLREGFLRQSAFLAADASSPPSKTVAMLRAFLHFHRRAEDAVRRGVLLRTILDAHLDGHLLRLPEAAPDEAPAAAEALTRAIDEAFAGLEATA
ncbi:MAG TPA: V-type ATP synthase subunit A [Anaeromyxobacteraceae bacterium]|nr:V-type ATP synthase subunit A [Anaeromyxobacteraceae bacterium]